MFGVCICERSVSRLVFHRKGSLSVVNLLNNNTTVPRSTRQRPLLETVALPPLLADHANPKLGLVSVEQPKKTGVFKIVERLNDFPPVTHFASYRFAS